MLFPTARRPAVVRVVPGLLAVWAELPLPFDLPPFLPFEVFSFGFAQPFLCAVTSARFSSCVRSFSLISSSTTLSVMSEMRSWLVMVLRDIFSYVSAEEKTSLNCSQSAREVRMYVE